jgi:hypothetical protein
VEQELFTLPENLGSPPVFSGVRVTNKSKNNESCSTSSNGDIIIKRVRIPLRRGVLDTTLCDQVCQWLVAGRLFYHISIT